jgi:iron complex transport system substrate-binding protein
VDDRGRTVQRAVPPQRVVSLLPSLTETVCALGQCHRLVGVDRDSNFPADVRHLPRLGGGLDPSIEAVVAARPDLVLLAASSRAAGRLEALGLNVLALEPKTHADVQRVLHTVALALGQPPTSAERVWQRIDAAMAQAAQSMPVGARSLRVYFEVSRAPHAAGASSFMGQTLARLGVQNVVDASMGPFPKLNPEYVVRANPDVILLSARNATELADRPGWRALRAVRENRVCAFNPADGDVLVRPGPRMAEAAQLLATCLAPHAAEKHAGGSTDKGRQP